VSGDRSARHVDLEDEVSTAVVLVAILGSLLLGVISPGPSFVMVAHTSIARSRRHGVASALGMGVGGVAFASLALVGLQALLMQVTWLYLILKIVGGAYLIYIAVHLWRGAPRPFAIAPAAKVGPSSLARTFWLGLATQISNPKTAIVYGSVFAALLPPAPPFWLLTLLPPLIFTLEAGWYVIVAIIFSSDRPRSAYLRSKAWIDRAVSGVMGSLGIRLLVDAAGR
jgi:threonine/homoserine/homoserine lactone efflux protein